MRGAGRFQGGFRLELCRSVHILGEVVGCVADIEKDVRRVPLSGSFQFSRVAIAIGVSIGLE